MTDNTVNNPFAGGFNPVLVAHATGTEVNPDVKIMQETPTAPVPVTPVVETPVPVEVVSTAVPTPPVEPTAPIDEFEAAMSGETTEEEATAEESHEEDSKFLDPDLLESMTLAQRKEFFDSSYMAVRITSKLFHAENHLGKKVVAREGYPTTTLYIPKLDFCNDPNAVVIANELYARYIKARAQSEENTAWKDWAKLPPYADGTRPDAPFVTNHREPENNEKAAFAFFNGMLIPVVTDFEVVYDDLFPTTHDDWVEWVTKGGFWDLMVTFYAAIKSPMGNRTEAQINQAKAVASRIHAINTGANTLQNFNARMVAIKECQAPDVVAEKEKCNFDRFYAYHEKKITAEPESAADIF